jgi:RNA polymerase sigma factor (sigma-70 family)
MRAGWDDVCPHTDNELIRRCLQGEEPAWTALRDRYGVLVYSIASRCHFSFEDVADVLQSVYLALLENLRSLERESRLSSWLRIVTLRECHRIRRRPHRLPIGEDRLQPTSLDLDENRRLSDGEIQWIEAQWLIRQALSLVEEPCRRLLISLFYEKGLWSHEEIARQTGLSVSAIEPEQAQCLNKLLTTLDRLGYFAPEGGSLEPHRTWERQEGLPGTGTLCPPVDRLLLFLQHELSPEENAQVRAHLDAGCGPCGKRFAKLQKVSSAAAGWSLSYPPDWLSAQVLGLFERVRGAPTESSLKRAFALLVADNCAKGQLLGFRSAGVMPRHLLYRTASYDIDLSVDDSDPQDSLVLMGQSIPLHKELTIMVGAKVELLNGPQVWTTFANAFGEFIFKNVPQGTYDLKITLPDEQIEIAQVEAVVPPHDDPTIGE